MPVSERLRDAQSIARSAVRVILARIERVRSGVRYRRSCAFRVTHAEIGVLAVVLE